MNDIYNGGREYLQGFFAEFDFPDEARVALLDTYDRIWTNDVCRKALTFAISQYVDTSYDYARYLGEVRNAFADAGICSYSGELVFVILLSGRLRELYAEAGIADDVYKASMLDVKYKLDECRCVKGAWGTFVAGWYGGFFAMKRFGLGRLQFDMTSLKTDYSGQGTELAEGAPVLAVHIPRTGVRLDHALVLDAYCKAAEFFAPYFKNSPVAFVCGSWLLYPKNKDILSPESNLYRFISDFDIVGSKDHTDYKEMWRLFDTEITDDIDALPRDTSLRRAYADIMKRGEPLGEGKGIYIFKR